jgi:hypothetical protein
MDMEMMKGMFGMQSIFINKWANCKLQTRASPQAAGNGLASALFSRSSRPTDEDLGYLTYLDL